MNTHDSGGGRVRRRCENCSSWGSSDSVWGECLRAESDDARMAVRETGEGVVEALETRYDFGCVEWKSANRPARREPPHVAD